MTLPAEKVARVSVVIPVYQGERTLGHLINELLPLTKPQRTTAGRLYLISEVLLVHDCGHDRSDLTIEALGAQQPFVRAIWLARNYGQHAATMAGMASATGDWVVTMDEDGQQDPTCMADMLDAAISQSLQVVYAKPINPPPHGAFRNGLSKLAKLISAKVLGNSAVGQFNSYRVIDGETARTLAAFCGHGVYLDVALYWVAGRIGHCPVRLRDEMSRPSGYSLSKLFGHFWNLVLTTGTRPLRAITAMGLVSLVAALGLSSFAIYWRLTDGTVQGWASLLIIVCFFSGAILVSLGIIAEYLAVTMGIAMGRPLYVISSKAIRRVTPT
jgi:polyisoprenyl-phosphate glycosyltransferase